MAQLGMLALGWPVPEHTPTKAIGCIAPPDLLLMSAHHSSLVHLIAKPEMQLMSIDHTVAADPATKQIKLITAVKSATSN